MSARAQSASTHFSSRPTHNTKSHYFWQHSPWPHSPIHQSTSMLQPKSSMQIHTIWMLQSVITSLLASWGLLRCSTTYQISQSARATIYTCRNWLWPILQLLLFGNTAALLSPILWWDSNHSLHWMDFVPFSINGTIHLSLVITARNCRSQRLSMPPLPVDSVGRSIPFCWWWSGPVLELNPIST